MTTAAAAAPDAKKAPDLIDMQTVTCAQYARALSYAKPGDKPSKEKAALAETAQDDLVQALTWVNGYLHARDGAKVVHTFNRDWIVNTMGKLSAVCKAGGATMTLSSAAAKL
ncbi:MAG: hypothetical protein ACK58C_07695 [Betaproteobacteria bacterium]